jgi:hypothetical protein
VALRVLPAPAHFARISMEAIHRDANRPPVASYELPQFSVPRIALPQLPVPSPASLAFALAPLPKLDFSLPRVPLPKLALALPQIAPPSPSIPAPLPLPEISGALPDPSVLLEAVASVTDATPFPEPPVYLADVVSYDLPDLAGGVQTVASMLPPLPLPDASQVSAATAFSLPQFQLPEYLARAFERARQGMARPSIPSTAPALIPSAHPAVPGPSATGATTAASVQSIAPRIVMQGIAPAYLQEYIRTYVASIVGTPYIREYRVRPPVTSPETSLSGQTISIVGDASIGGTLTAATTTLATTTQTGPFTFADILGAAQCLHVDADGLVSGSGSDCGGAASLTYTYPLVKSGSILSLAFGTTTSNTWSGTQTFSNALSTNATTTTLGVNGETFTDLTGTGLQLVSGALTLDASGDWTGTLDSQEGTFYLANSFSSTSAQYFVNASTTIPKTYGTNTFTGANVFSGAFTLGSLNGPLQANNGIVSATTSISVLYGGTGLSSVGDGRLVYGNSGSALTSLATSTGGFLSNSYTTGRPAWTATSTLNLDAGVITAGSLGVTRGGTGLSSIASSSLLIGGPGNIVIAYATSSLGIALTDTTGVLTVAKGGTGTTTAPSGQLLYGGAAGVYLSVATSSASCSSGVSCTAFTVVGTVSPSITNTGLLSLQQTGGGTAQTGAITFATSSDATTGLTLGMKITNSSGAFTFTPTLTGTLALANGGTATTTYYAGGIVYSDGSKLTQPSGSGNASLTWDNTNARFGISTTSPFAKFSVEQSTESVSFVVGHTGSTTPSFIISGVNGNGRVGIATTTSTSTALVVGNNAISGAVATFGNSTGICTINPTASSIGCTSDERLKKNINPLASAYVGVLELAPVTYNWRREDDQDPKHTGFIAQQVEKIFPDLVSTDEHGMKLLNYAGLTPYLVSAFQLQNRALDIAAALPGARTLRSAYQSSSTPAIDIDEKGAVSVGALTTSGRLRFADLPTSSTGMYLCIDEDGEITSGERCKAERTQPVRSFVPLVRDALGEVLALRPLAFTSANGSTRYGFAPADVEDNLVTFDEQGEPAFDYKGYTAVLTLAVQQLNTKMSAPTDYVHATTSALALVTAGMDSATAGGAFAGSSDGLRAALGELGDATLDALAQGVYAATGVFDRLFAKEVHTDLLCVGATCVTEAQLKALLADQASDAPAPPADEPNVSANDTETPADDASTTPPVSEPAPPPPAPPASEPVESEPVVSETPVADAPVPPTL